jgi:hypothetical protein
MMLAVISENYSEVAETYLSMALIESRPCASCTGLIPTAAVWNRKRTLPGEDEKIDAFAVKLKPNPRAAGE